MDHKSFFELSELAEKLLSSLGVDVRDEHTHEYVRRCSGESLYDIIVHNKNFMFGFGHLERTEDIISIAGDRTTKYSGDFGDCWGETSHSTAGTLIQNIATEFYLEAWEAIGQPADKKWPLWSDLSIISRTNMERIERRSCAPKHGMSQITSAIRIERILYSKRKPKLEQNKVGTVTDRDRAKVKNTIANHRKQYGGSDPQQKMIAEKSELSPGKVQTILDELRVSGEWDVPPRTRRGKS